MCGEVPQAVRTRPPSVRLLDLGDHLAPDTYHTPNTVGVIFGVIYFKKHCLCIYEFWQYLENIAYVIFRADIARLLQYFNNISDRLRNILEILQYFQGIFVQYCLIISVLCGLVINVSRD